LAKEKAIAFEALAGEKFIMQQPRTYQYREVYARCSEAGFVPDVLLCTSQLKTIKQLVANGMGVSILPNFVTGTENNFVLRPLAPALSVQITLNWSAGKQLTDVDAQFKGFIKEYAEKHL
jgi:DNA-binding transcriptional LysR family regulator